MLGAVDLGAELGLEPRADGLELLYARSKVVVDSAAAGIRAPFDIVHLDIARRRRARGGTRASRARSASAGKACIHPDQVADRQPRLRAERATRSPGRGGWSTAYEQASGEGRGAVALDGEMIDLPVVERARQILADAKGA